MNMRKSTTPKSRLLASAAAAVFGASWGLSLPVMATTPAPITISQVPMTVTLPAHPQIVLAVGNSQSMDGTLSGAIYTGSGSLPAALAALNNSSSPLNYSVPAGFTPPLNAGSGGTAPYTVTVGSVLEDNSASRLNVAKAGIASILNAYIASADFALMDYSVSGLTAYTTWVYQMSNPGGFTFVSTPPTSGEYVANPCYGVNPLGGTQLDNDCSAIDTLYASQAVALMPYMAISASSDDPSINDVLYATTGQSDPVCVVYENPIASHLPPSPATPFPPNYTITTYNDGDVYEAYNKDTATCATETGPTNAGYVPYTPQVMYEERGFGFYTTGESGSAGTMVVPMTSSGATPTAASVATAIGKFTPYLAPETNSTGTTEIKASATQSPIAGMMKQINTYFTSTPPATTNGCTAQRYVVLITDGLPTEDLNGHSWPPLGSTAAAGYGVSATFNTNGSLATTNDQALTDVINQISALNSGATPIQTYIIGVGAGVNPALNPSAAATLTAMAVAGGSGTYFAATSEAQVTSELEVIITTILKQTQATASSAVNSTGLNTNSVVYQSQFTTSDVYQDWTGNMLAYPINPSTGVVNTNPADTLWSAQTQLDGTLPTARMIATWDPVAGAGTPFEWTGGTPSRGIGSSTTLGQDLETYSLDTSGSDVLSFLRGSSTQEVRNGGTFRNRSHKLADIVDSNPAYIGPSNESIETASYATFAQGTLSRAPVIYIGANDGMLHAFDAGTGNERFAYIPAGAYANLIKLVSPYYNAQHQFYVDGSPQAGDVQFSDGSWHSVLVGAEAQGGNSVYALDITNPQSLGTEAQVAGAVLWDFTNTNMGLGFSTPTIADTTSGWQVFVGNGYNSTNEEPFLFAINPQTGALNAAVNLCAAVPSACNLSKPNGLSSVTAVNSSGQVGGYANIVYAGDLQGNLWRVNVSGSTPSTWTVSVVFQARDSLGNMQPITTAPVVTLNPKYPQTLGTMVLFGTGQFLGSPDLTNENVQSVYGVYDPPGGWTTPLTRSGLIQQTLSTAMIGSTQVRTVSTNAVSVPTNSGWYMDLNLLSGERVITNPALEAGGEFIFTTYQPIPPSSTSCTSSGSAYLMVLNYATGSSFTTPQFDVNGTGTINASDQVVTTTTSGTVTQNPVGMSLGNVYATAPTIRSGNFTTGSAMALITLSSVGITSTGAAPPPPPGCSVNQACIKPVLLKGAARNRTAWWEIRQ
ncbi:MAG TPA: PilC/PilY family type IV pilus protein [Steroidobacteraceae bacterium]|nr:PilC/PilY family type IV pilus protein [Steroidobacteraceae bacterium]